MKIMKSLKIIVLYSILLTNIKFLIPRIHAHHIVCIVYDIYTQINKLLCTNMRIYYLSKCLLDNNDFVINDVIELYMLSSSYIYIYIYIYIYYKESIMNVVYLYKKISL